MLAAALLAWYTLGIASAQTPSAAAPSASASASSKPVSQVSSGSAGQASASPVPSPNTNTTPTNASADLSFGPVHFAGHANYVHRDNVTSAQIVVSDTASDAPARFITAFPNGNTGAMVYFVPKNGSLGVSLKDVETVFHDEDKQTGIGGHLTLSGDASFGVTLLGSVRTLRDYTESKGTVMHSVFNYSLGGYGENEVWLVRDWINGSTVQYLGFFAEGNNTRLDVRPSDNTTLPPSINVTRVDGKGNATLRFESTFNFTRTTPETPYVPLRGLGVDDLFPAANGTLASTSEDAVVAAIRGPGKPIAEQMAFLATQTEFFAGGWRFLTYFGRDTLLALQLLMPVLSPEASEAILAAVIQRTNATSGGLCHEETIGDYASYLHIQEGKPELGNTPSYAYTMLDTDFLLLPVLADFAASYPGRVKALLERNSTLVQGTYGQLLATNVEHVLNLTRAFSADPQPSNLLPVRSYPVGNWRDSNAGLGWGTYPFDVNCALVPAALRAIGQLAGLVLPESYTNATEAATVWEQHACAAFAVPVSAQDAATRLDAYVAKANLSSALLYGAGSLNGSKSANDSGWNAPGQVVGSSLSMSNATTSNFTAPNTTSSSNTTSLSNSTSSLYALSLMADHTPVPVQHSDLAFALLYTTPPAGVIQATIDAMQPYPRGLLTNAGMVVANAAYDGNASSAETFSNTAYHGAVAWSWQQGFMAAGVARQLQLCRLRSSIIGGGDGGQSPVPQNASSSSSASDASSTSPSRPTTPRIARTPEWCDTLSPALEQAQTRLWDAIAGTADVLWTEVWTPVFDNATGTFTIGDLGALSPEGTEGDAIQLWSYGFLAMTDPRTGKPVAGGFAKPEQK